MRAPFSPFFLERELYDLRLPFTIKLLLSVAPEVKIISEEETGKNFLAVFSEYNFQDFSSLRKYSACIKISEDPEIIRQDSRVKNDARIYLNDLYEKLQFTIRALFRRDESKLVAPIGYEKQDSLQKIVSEILTKRFPLCPKINSEFINREQISPIIRNTRKKILRDMISGDTSLGLRDAVARGEPAALHRSERVPVLASPRENRTLTTFRPVARRPCRWESARP